MAWETYNPRTIRNLLLDRGITAGDLSRRTKGRVGRATIRELTVGRNPTTQTATLQAVAKALSVPMEDLQRGE